MDMPVFLDKPIIVQCTWTARILRIAEVHKFYNAYSRTRSTLYKFYELDRLFAGIRHYSIVDAGSEIRPYQQNATKLFRYVSAVNLIHIRKCHIYLLVGRPRREMPRLVFSPSPSLRQPV